MNIFLSSSPEGAVILFDGANLDAWTTRDGKSPAAWPVDTANATMLTRGGDIVSRARFGDFQLHLEFLCGDSPPHVRGQGRANSGVFLQGRYEIQVLDSFGIAGPPGLGDCGAIYNQSAPLVNASLPPTEWQSYDIIFRGPRFDANGAKTGNARVTVWQNGRVIHNNAEIPTQTGAALDEFYDQPGPLLLQDHGNDVRFRNLWILPLPSGGATHYSGADDAGTWQNLLRPTLMQIWRRWFPDVV